MHCVLQSSKLLIQDITRSINESMGILQFVGKPYGQIGSGGWSPPLINYVKLNCDGVVCQTIKEASCGGVIWDSKGNLVKALSRRLRFYSILEAEFWAMSFVLRMIEEANCKKII